VNEVYYFVLTLLDISVYIIVGMRVTVCDLMTWLCKYVSAIE